MLYYYLVKYEKTVWVGLLALLIWMAAWVLISRQITLVHSTPHWSQLNERVQLQRQEKVDSRMQFGLILVLLATAKRFRKDWRREPFI